MLCSETPNKQRLDKRLCERIETDLEICYSDGKRFYIENLIDISEGGILVTGSKNLDEGTRLIITIPLDPPIKIIGSCRWTQKKGIKHIIGIQFANYTRKQQDRIRELISSILWDPV